jgi:hypothetical protein
MKALIANPDFQFRALEWVFGIVVVALVAGALGLGWLGSMLDGVAAGYSDLFTTTLTVREVNLPPESALERYVPGEPFPAGRTNPDS